jgi:hypothetical protein
MLYGNTHNNGTPFWARHESALYDAGVVTVKHPTVNANGVMSRIFTALMLYRAADFAEPEVDFCLDPEFANTPLCADTTNPTNPTTPTNPIDSGYDNTNRPVSNGSLTLTASSKLPNFSSIPGTGVVTFANMKASA